MMKKYIVFTLLFSLAGMSISVQAMKRKGGGEERHGSGGKKIGGNSKKIKATKCSICLEQGAKEVNLQILSCGHEFHAKCLGDYIRDAFGSSNSNFDELKCPLFSSACVGVLTREQIDRFTSSSSSSPAATPGNSDILAFFDERAAERANPTVIIRQKPDAATLSAIAAGYLQICPGCKRTTSRIDGCNRMTCSIGEGGCGVDYCYACGTGYNPLINNGIGWGARACACPHFPGAGWAAEPIPMPGAHGGARPQVNLIAMAIINAVREGHLAVVQALLAGGIEVNTQNNYGWTALHMAANQGRLEIVQALLATPGIQVNTPDNEGWMPLHRAAHQGHLAAVQALIAAPGIQVNTPDNEGWMPLHRAAHQGHLAVVQALLAAPGIQVNTPDNEGLTGLHWAAHQGHLAVVQELLTAGMQVNTPDNEGLTALHEAAMRGHLGVVQELLAAGAQVNTPDNLGMTALHRAAHQGRLAVVAALLMAGAQ